MVRRAVSVCHIQHDFEQCIEEEDQDGCNFYINVDISQEEVKEYIIRKLPSTEEFDAGDGNYFERLRRHTYKAVLDNEEFNFLGIDTDFTTAFASGGPENDWTVIDTTTQPEEAYALGDASGNFEVYDSSLKLKRVFTAAHAGELTSLKFFPSGEVILSSSIDTQIKLWSLIDGSNPRTFEGHKGTVTGTCMIDRGRNFVSSSSDGTARLWECGSGQTIHSFTRRENPHDGINAIDLFSDNQNFPPVVKKPLEFGTQGKHLLAGHSSGVLTLHDIYSKAQQLQIPSKFLSGCSALKVDQSNKNYVFAGYENGVLAQWDLRQPKSEIDCISINEGTPINEIFLHSGSIYISSGVDTSLFLGRGVGGRCIKSESPTFLVSNDYRTSQFISNPGDNGLIVVGNWGFCAKYL